VFFLAMHPEIDDEQVHCELEVDLVEHPWARIENAAWILNYLTSRILIY
jgi:hypothetical protein